MSQYRRETDKIYRDLKNLFKHFFFFKPLFNQVVPLYCCTVYRYLKATAIPCC